jgi:hypothetical protein
MSYARIAAVRQRSQTARAESPHAPRRRAPRGVGAVAVLGCALALLVVARPDASAGRSLPARGAAASVKTIIGTNDGAGWGPEAARTILAGHISWDRVELQSNSDALSNSLKDGFKVLAIVNNSDDGTPISAIEPAKWGAEVASEIKAGPGISIAEAGNEMYLKGGVANPVQYGRMYLAAVERMTAAGIHVPLLFNMIGDYPLGSWSAPKGWSEDARGGGWLRSAVNGVPGLAAAILANGLSIHPYGALGEDNHDDYGVSAAAAEEKVAATVLGSTPPVYVTEFGYDLRSCGKSIGACSARDQANKMQAAYSALLADPHVAGIWWYQSHDDNTGHFGFMNKRSKPRRSFKTLATLAAAEGQ